MARSQITQTTKITTVEQLDEIIAELAERVAALEAVTGRVAALEAVTGRVAALEAAPRCRCGTCKIDQEDREQHRIMVRAAEIFAMPAEQRNRELASLSGREFDNFVKQVVLSNDVIPVVIEATPELRARIMPSVRGVLRRRVELTLNPPPARVNVEKRSGVHVSQLEIKVHELDAVRLTAAGLTCDKRQTESGIRHYYRRPELAGRWTYTTAQWYLILGVDEQLRRLVESGLVVVTPLTVDENIHYQIELEADARDARRYAEAPPELVVTPVIG